MTDRVSSKYLFVLDTGATRTTIHPHMREVLRLVRDTTRTVTVTTASGQSTAAFYRVPRVAGLGIERSNFTVLVQPFPPSFTADGLLGLDFFRGHVLTLDFLRNIVDLRPPRPWWQFWA
jgi:predicted aspartyl protease